ncbi:hypothetical protein KDK77_05980 [bacterium]|nr:hypothetical protein [bacterium]MCP5462082.1 hypothetical protein [bacterium]
MGTLYIYGIFHANLSFSSIPPDQYSKIIDTCYWPVIELVRKGYKLGLEFNTYTLHQIEKLDNCLLHEIRKLWENGACDIIGSSYIQSISPLIPYEINKANFVFGQKDYRSLLGASPSIGFVNEQTYSKGIPNLFSEIGYESFVMDWDNAAEFNDYPPDLRYRPALAKGIGDVTLPVIWNSSLNSYKFQRCVYKRISVDDYIESILTHHTPLSDRALLIYGTDWEIFDYRPGTQQEAHSEIARIEQIFQKLTALPTISLVTPSEIIAHFQPDTVISLESPQCPIPCKNRDDYNVLRWSVSGRDNVHLNTECFKTYQQFKNFSCLSGIESDALRETLLRKINESWGSDLRTKTTDEKHYSNKRTLGEVSHILEKSTQEIYAHFPPEYDFILINPLNGNWNYEPYCLDLMFKPGEKKGSVVFELDGTLVTAQIEEFELYKDGSYRRIKAVLMPFIASGNAAQGRIRCIDTERPIYPDLRTYIGDKLRIETAEVNLLLSASTGADIRHLTFPTLSPHPLIGYLPPVYYDHIGHSNDYYSGGLVIGDSFGKMYNDTTPTVLYVPEDSASYPIRIPVRSEINLGIGICWKEYFIYQNIPRIDLNYRFYFNDLHPSFFRVGITTLNPESFAKDTLRFSTVNGYQSIETFFPQGKGIHHTNPVGTLSSARTSLGATEGWIDISDDKKGITIASDKAMLFSVPLIEFEEIKKSYLFRIYHSISESDETGRGHFRGHTSISFSYFGHKNNLEQTRTAVTHMSHGLICIPSSSAGIKSLNNKQLHSVEK